MNRRQLLSIPFAAMGVCVLPVSELVAGAQLLDARRRIGGGELAFARRTASDLAIAYAAKPDADVVRAATAHAHTLLDRLKNVTMAPEVAIRLRVVASDAACLAGYGEMNAGRLDQAKRWFNTALTLARQAGDRRVEALALACTVGRDRWLEQPWATNLTIRRPGRRRVATVTRLTSGRLSASTSTPPGRRSRAACRPPYRVRWAMTTEGLGRRAPDLAGLADSDLVERKPGRRAQMVRLMCSGQPSAALRISHS